MRELPPLMAYPVSRLTLAWAVGVLLFDWLRLPLWEILLALSLVFVALVVVCRSSSLKYRNCFGGLAFVAFVLMGGFRLIQECSKIDYSWSGERMVYWGEVMTPPVTKGKMLQAEVLIKTQVDYPDSQKKTDSSQSAASVHASSSVAPDHASSSLVSDHASSSLVSVHASSSVAPDHASSSLVSDHASSSLVSVHVSSSLVSDHASPSLASVHASPSWIPVRRRILLYWMPDSLQRSVRCGDNLLFAGVVSRPLSEEELTGFDYGKYLYRRGLSATAMAFVGDWRVCDRKKPLTVRQLALRCRDFVVRRYREWKLGDDELAVVAALTVGDKSVLNASLKEMYSAAGVSHVLALSGLHVGILSAILYFLLAPLRHGRWGDELRTSLVVLLLWCFAFITGLSPSVVRAVLMCSLYFLASCVNDGKFPSLYILMLAAFLMLVWQPLYLFDLSCQLSFLAVASILYFYPVFSDLFVSKYKVIRWLWNGLSVSVSAQLGTLPLILYYFGTFPTYFLLANLIVSVLAACVLVGALVALCLSSLPVVGAWVTPASVAFLRIVTYGMNTSIRWVQHLSGSQLDTLSISLLQSVCGFVFLVFLYQYLHHHKAVYLAAILLAVNVTLADWTLRPLHTAPPAYYLWRSHLYLKQDDQLTELASPTQLYQLDTLRIGILTDDRWRKKESHPHIPVHYLYLCRGFKGNLKSLLRVFHVEHILLDASLSPYYRESLKKDCSEQEIPCTDISHKGSYRILL